MRSFAEVEHDALLRARGQPHALGELRDDGERRQEARDVAVCDCDQLPAGRHRERDLCFSLRCRDFFGECAFGRSRFLHCELPQ